jgi:hypothetical protein
VIAYLVLSGIQVVLASRGSTNVVDYKPASAIVLLGAPSPGGVAGTHFLGRLQTTAKLFSGRLAPRVVITGSGGTAASQEVIKAGREWLIANGVSAGAISSIDSANAIDGLKGATASLGANTRVLVVTDAINLLWTKGAATSAGLIPTVVPAEGSKVPLYSQIVPFAIQTSGVAAGRLVGDLRTTWAAT